MNTTNEMSFDFAGSAEEIAEQVADLRDMIMLIVTNYSPGANWHTKISGSYNEESTGLRSAILKSLNGLIEELKQEDDIDLDDDCKINILIKVVEP